jgi:hypothetical protein
MGLFLAQMDDFFTILLRKLILSSCTSIILIFAQESSDSVQKAARDPQNPRAARICVLKGCRFFSLFTFYFDVVGEIGAGFETRRNEGTKRRKESVPSFQF